MSDLTMSDTQTI
ncbi:mannose-6-phosphate isomerase, class I, partial [Vibrio parahaemolyticus IDH02189]